MDRIRLFFQLVCRPHPYCIPAESVREAWVNWTQFFVGPVEAWHIAGVLAQCPKN